MVRSAPSVDEIVDDTRDRLQALMHLERRFYRRSNYLCTSDDDVEDGDNDCNSERCTSFASHNRASSLDMIAEMASLVTDLRLVTPCDGTQTQGYQRTATEETTDVSTPEASKTKKTALPNMHSPASSTTDLYLHEAAQCPETPTKGCDKPQPQPKSQLSSLEALCWEQLAAANV